MLWGMPTEKIRFTRTDSATSMSSDARTPTPNLPIRASTIDPDTWSEGVRFAGAQVPLGRLGGGRDIGVNLVHLPPGKQSCPFHWHVREEEHFYVLEGQRLLRVGTDRHAMAAGDYVCFPAGTGIGHCFENPYESACRLLAIGSRDRQEIAVYPDSGKMKLRALNVIVPYAEDSLDYWLGERADQVLTDPDDA